MRLMAEAWGFSFPVLSSYVLAGEQCPRPQALRFFPFLWCLAWDPVRVCWRGEGRPGTTREGSSANPNDHCPGDPPWLVDLVPLSQVWQAALAIEHIASDSFYGARGFQMQTAWD